MPHAPHPQPHRVPLSELTPDQLVGWDMWLIDYQSSLDAGVRVAFEGHVPYRYLSSGVLWMEDPRCQNEQTHDVMCTCLYWNGDCDQWLFWWESNARPQTPPHPLR